jgi:hypothetical protein
MCCEYLDDENVSRSINVTGTEKKENEKEF